MRLFPILAALAATPALAAGSPAEEPVAPPNIAVEKSVFDGDFFIVVAGVLALPSYEGSDDTAVLPAGAIAGRVGGVGINPRAAGLALDLVPDREGARAGLSFGPVIRMRTNRSGRIKDPVVQQLGKLPKVFEGGVQAGVTLRRVFNPHDQLSIGADIRWDISGKGSGYVVAPSVSYLTPLSRKMVAGALVSAEVSDSRYARFNYDVTPAGSLASGLPVYTAHGGLKAVNYGMFLARDLNGNLLDGGLLVGGGVMYSRLYGSAAETPLTTLRGSRSQWFFGGGLGYVF
ncbi:MAG: MipA/OmpV family protein [Novosphingobium sp.]